MNSRERVRAVLAHKTSDRIPNGLGGCETAGMHIVAYDRLQKVLGCESAPPRLDTFMVNAVFEEPLIKAMDGDIILLDSPRMCQSQLRGDVADDIAHLDDIHGFLNEKLHAGGISLGDHLLGGDRGRSHGLEGEKR